MKFLLYIQNTDIDSTQLLVFALIYIALFLLSLFVAKAVFRIDTLIQYQHKHYQMLRQIASKLGVEERLIKEVDENKEQNN